jgi:hypothetical protein
MNVEFTFLESVSGSLQAEIIRGLLESRGIRVMLSQESAGTVLGLGVGPTAHVDILVPQSQHDKAMELLEQYYAGELDVE